MSMNTIHGIYIKFNPMKKVVAVFALAIVCACSDGDLQIENIDFDGGTVTFCPLLFEQEDIERTLFFKIVEDEALILDLQSGLIENLTPEDTITSDLGSQSTLTYRLFTETISNDYFCSEIPPLTPGVLEETTASDGIVNIVTMVDTVTNSVKTYIHDISISDLTITNESNERITDEPGLDFGTYSTTLDSSVEQEFENYPGESIVICENESTSAKLVQLLNDEAIDFEFPLAFLVNQATDDPRTFSLGSVVNDTTATFSNKVFKRIVDEDLICSETPDISDLENEFRTVSGTLSIATTEDDDSTPENGIFNHTLTLSNFVLEDSNGNASSEIETYVFGTVTTTTN